VTDWVYRFKVAAFVAALAVFATGVLWAQSRYDLTITGRIMVWVCAVAVLFGLLFALFAENIDGPVRSVGMLVLLGLVAGVFGLWHGSFIAPDRQAALHIRQDAAATQYTQQVSVGTGCTVFDTAPDVAVNAAAGRCEVTVNVRDNDVLAVVSGRLEVSSLSGTFSADRARLTIGYHQNSQLNLYLYDPHKPAHPLPAWVRTSPRLVAFATGG